MHTIAFAGPLFVLSSRESKIKCVMATFFCEWITCSFCEIWFDISSFVSTSSSLFQPMMHQMEVQLGCHCRQRSIRKQTLALQRRSMKWRNARRIVIRRAKDNWCVLAKCCNVAPTRKLLLPLLACLCWMKENTSGDTFHQCASSIQCHTTGQLRSSLAAGQPHSQMQRFTPGKNCSHWNTPSKYERITLAQQEWKGLVQDSAQRMLRMKGIGTRFCTTDTIEIGEKVWVPKHLVLAAKIEHETKTAVLTMKF